MNPNDNTPLNADTIHQFMQGAEQITALTSLTTQKMQDNFNAVSTPITALSKLLASSDNNSLQQGLKSVTQLMTKLPDELPVNHAFETANQGGQALQQSVQDVVSDLSTLAKTPAVQQAVGNFITLKNTGKSTFTELGTASKNFHLGFINTLGSMVASGKLQFSSLFTALAQDISKILVYYSITKPLTSFVNSLFSFGGGGGGLSDLGSVFGNFALGSIPGRALGGPVFSGSPYMVGENGPELFVPQSSGNIVSNSKLSFGQAAMAPVTVSNHWTIMANDTRGFDELLASRRHLFESWSVQSVQKAFNKRGRYGPLDSGRT